MSALQVNFGFEGVAVDGHTLAVAFQRAWGEERDVRIGLFDKTECIWRFVFYPLDSPASPNGEWVGVSDLALLGNGEILAVGRDNQGGTDAAIKKLTRFSINGVGDGSLVTKTLVDNLLGDLRKPAGLVPEKIEVLHREICSAASTIGLAHSGASCNCAESSGQTRRPFSMRTTKTGSGTCRLGAAVAELS